MIISSSPIFPTPPGFLNQRIQKAPMYTTTIQLISELAIAKLSDSQQKITHNLLFDDALVIQTKRKRVLFALDAHNTLTLQLYRANSKKTPQDPPITTHDPKDPSFNPHDIVTAIHQWITT